MAHARSTARRLAIRILNESDVRALLPMGECVDAMSDVLAALSRGECAQPVRSKVPLPGGSGVFGMMPGALGAGEAFGIKAISVMPGNRGTPYESHQGAVLLFEADHGSLLAVLDAASVTAIRTAAASAAATRVLARLDAGDLAILGSGTQAAAHLEAMRCVRDVRRVRVWSRNRDAARTFARRESARHGLDVIPVESGREAVEGADLVCTATGASEPVLLGEWIAPGAHVNAVGACFPSARELDTAAVARSRLFVDHRPAALAEAGDILIPMREGAIGEDHIAGEIGAAIAGRTAGRTSPAEVTLFKSLGLAVEDLAAARLVYRNALTADKGATLDWGGLREAD